MLSSLSSLTASAETEPSDEPMEVFKDVFESLRSYLRVSGLQRSLMSSSISMKERESSLPAETESRLVDSSSSQASSLWIFLKTSSLFRPLSKVSTKAYWSLL